MPKHSAGLLLFRTRHNTLEVFLVHPGGPFWKHKDQHSWSIPKGEFDPDDESAFDAACREFHEETHQAPTPQGHPKPLEPVRTSSGKTIYAFAFHADCDPDAVLSNTFSLEWPPHSDQHQEFPEVDRAAWFPLDAARQKIHKGQLPLLDQLTAILTE